MTRRWTTGLALLLTGCTGFLRDCAAYRAENFGSNWVVVQYGAAGLINCWKLENVGITNEPQSDGIYWQQGAHLVHISGWYNRVQVGGGDFVGAARVLGKDVEACLATK